MENINKVRKEIETIKNRLRKKTLIENFGQNEVRKLQDKYFDHAYKNDGI